MTSAEHEYHPLRIAEVVEETADTKSFVLDVPDALDDEFSYVAGQFCTFRADIAGASTVRCYSMSSSPDTDDPLTVTVKRVPDGLMSNWMNDRLVAGSTIEVMRPAGLFVLHDHDTPIVAFAGGSGVTPVISIIKSALVTTTREITLVYANRTKEAVIFAEELDRLEAGSGGRLSVHHHLDEDRGFLDAPACAALVGDRTGADFYVCGPGPYMETVEAGLELLGVSRKQLHVERFLAPAEIPALTETSGTEEVVIRLNRRTQTVEYRLGDTLLETARRADMNPPFSCEAGSCATCMAKLESGSATMRVNNALTPDEIDEGWVLTCQGIPTSRTVSVNYDA
jgi:ferredoxin-NADP reductase